MIPVYTSTYFYKPGGQASRCKFKLDGRGRASIIMAAAATVAQRLAAFRVTVVTEDSDCQ